MHCCTNARAMTRIKRAIHGWLVLDKPEGISSAQAVGRARWLSEAAKAGYAGTLDPAASGVLPIAFGEATKTMSHAVDGTKSYRFTVRWGEARDTDDAEGCVVARSEHMPDAAAIASALEQFRGEIEQIPPVYSALKVDGQRAYVRARRNENVVLAPRQVRVDVLELIEATGCCAEFHLECGKGTYVRAIARDLAQTLGTVGHVTRLRRTRVGPFDEADAISLDKLEELVHSAALTEHLLPVEAALVDIPALALTDAQAEHLRHGRAISVERIDEGTVFATASGRPVALAEVANGEARPVRVFNL
jgi:tRNA pseudouridine55 synthase